MKTYSYLIDGETSLNSINNVKQYLADNKPDGVSFAIEENPYSVLVAVDDDSTLDSKEIEEILETALGKVGLSLILPANVKNFSFVGEKKRVERTVSLRTLIVAISITLVISVLFTYVFASGLFKTPEANQNQGSEVIDISDATKQVEILNKIFAQLEFDYEKLDPDVLTDALLKAYVEASGDKYAIYYNAEEYAAWLESQKGTTAGIGISVKSASITVNGEDITVIKVLYVNSKSPAKEAGIMAGDYIYAIGRDESRVLVNDIGYDKAMDLMLGEIDTVADISVYRKGEGGEYASIDFSPVRKSYESDTVYGQVCTTDSRVGIVKMLSFGLKTPKQFTETVDALKAQGCEYFIFDLRSNPGGDLNAIKAILSYFLNEGDLILTVEYTDGTVKDHYATPTEYDKKSSYYDCSIKKEDIGKYSDLKFNIITDKNTASAAELFTATVRDYNLGKIIGEERTYGKGCMQNILSLSTYGLEGGLRVTTSMYFSKSRTIYHDIGITPDIVEPMNNEARKYSAYELPHNIDNQLQRAIEELIK